MISRGKDSGEGVCSATTGRVVSRRGPPRCVVGRRRRVVDDARRRRDEARRGREEAEAPSPKSRVGRGEARAVVARRSRSRRPARHLRRNGLSAAGEEAAEAAALGRRRRRGGRARRAEGAGRGGVGPRRAEGPRLRLRAVACRPDCSMSCCGLSQTKTLRRSQEFPAKKNSRGATSGRR